MKRTYKKRALFDFKRLGQFTFTLFVVFIAYKILTPPSNETVRITSPDGSKTARLRTFFYYDNQPSYKVYYREEGKRVWLSLLSLPAYTNTPPETHQPDLKWSPDSGQIDLLLSGTSVWHHAFAE
ncbi:hypothetical protein P4B35_08050 [Pontiellaceae bacterium B12227]|nr:hypothetical protein [Pontiellaceae bacterium B12227]